MRNVRGNRRGFVILMLAGIVLTLVPLVGLAIDAAVLYVIKARLSAACDAASLAAARNLNVGSTMTDQANAARDRAASFFAANFPDHYLGATRNAPNIDIPTNSPNSVMTVSTSASATASTYFMRALGVNNVTVSATGTASRRDVNLMLVLDRSTSMNDSNSCGPMRTAATDFVNRFVDGRDTVGMITFGSNYVLQTPSVYFKSSVNNLPGKISQLGCGDNTAITMAYSEAYKQLVDHHEPGALNAIVLFTDGVPNGIYASFDVKTQQDTRYGYTDGACGTNTQCTIPASPCSSGSNITGVITQTSGFASTGNTVGPWIAQASSITSHSGSLVSSGVSGCAFRGSNGTTYPERMRRDLRHLPDTDYYGNRFDGIPNQYLQYNNSGQSSARDDAPGFPTKIRLDRPSTIGIASKNSLDHAAQRVRARVRDSSIGVVTFVIGLGSAAQPESERPDTVLMRRVANDPLSNIYVDDPELPDGMYVRVDNAQQMAEAFQRIASEVLRLSR